MPEPTTAESPEVSLLRSAGLRVTAPRLAVLQALEAKSHLDADQVAAKVRSNIGPTATQTIYDVLHALTDAELIRRIEPAGRPMLYERRTGDNHHHLVCRHCSRIEDVDCAVGYTPCLTAIEDAGFIVDEAEVTYWGTCPDCQQDTAATPSRPQSNRIFALSQ
ncbi:MAG: transcriptional repressor [Bifidobacteriaceae bacterium]|nr:transcriptional repressor [Bifidobacteriaceae bacterium]